jgi:type II secretory pathway pseudopilin PulG
MPTSGTGSSSRARGFSFLELALVVFIISLLFALVGPRLKGRSESLRAEALKAASLLRTITDEAVLGKKTLALSIELKDGSVSIDGKPRLTLQGLQAVELPSRGRLTEGSITVFFGPTGASEDIALYLAHQDEGYKVSLSALGTRVHIHELQGI